MPHPHPLRKHLAQTANRSAPSLLTPSSHGHAHEAPEASEIWLRGARLCQLRGARLCQLRKGRLRRLS